MSQAQQLFDYQRKFDENQSQVREMVLESYSDIITGKGRDCNEFLDELEQRYSDIRVYSDYITFSRKRYCKSDELYCI